MKYGCIISFTKRGLETLLGLPPNSLQSVQENFDRDTIDFKIVTSNPDHFYIGGTSINTKAMLEGMEYYRYNII